MNLLEEQQETSTSLQQDASKLGQRFTPVQAAEELGLSVHTLASWRTNHPGKLPFLRTGKKGGRVFYFKKHLDEFLVKNIQGL